ncbi:MAG TPA: S9 family peptidase [Gemmatimonadales bacterium]
MSPPLIGLLLVATTVAAQPRPLSQADLGRIASIGEVRMSPRGDRVAYVQSYNDYAANRSRSGIVILAVPGGEEMRTIAGSSPRWSPDGSKVAFSATREGRSGIWIHDIGAGTDRFLVAVHQTDHWLGRGANKNFEWSPDGRWIAYVAAEGPARQPESDVRAYSRLMWKTRTGFSDDRKTHIWVMPAAGGQPRLLTPGKYDEHSVAWAPDSKRLAFVSDRSADPDDSFANDLFILDLTSGSATRLTNTASAEFLPAWSPDGQWIAFEGWVRSNNTKDSPAEDTKLFVISASGGRPRQVARALDRRVGEISWHPRGALYFTAGDRGRTAIYRALPVDTLAEPLIHGDFQARGYSMDARGASMAFLRSDPSSPPEVYVAETGGRVPRALTRLHDVLRQDVALADADEFWAQSSDGTPVQGWLMKPAGFRDDERYPLILNIHGGPHGMYGWTFSDRFQLQTAAGYGVLFINPRGSSGYGQRFSDGSVLNWGGGDYQDLMAGLNEAIGRNPWIDTTRLGVTGGSYGGYMTNWVISQTGRFKAAVASASVSNLISFYGTSLYTDLIESEFRGRPWKNWDMLWQWSPLAHVEGVTTPTLFIHGEVDHDVPITQAEEMFVALRKQGVPATLVRYPNEGHGLRQPAHVLDSIRRTLAWFDRYLKGRPATD